MTPARKLGFCIRKLRLEAGLNQVQLAVRAGMYRTNLSRVECGRYHIPRTDTIMKIAKALECKITDIYEVLD